MSRPRSHGKVSPQHAHQTVLEDADALLSLPSGAVFRRVDLHVHTPASPDTHQNWKTAKPEDVVQNALASGMDVIAVTDHDSAEWCDAVRDAAKDTPLVVFPGVEISTSEGHLLAIFDPSTPAQTIRELLIRCGIAATEFGKPGVLASGQLDHVAKQVEAAGGIAIAAHVDQAKGFWRVLDGSRARRQQLYGCPSILALEVVSEAELNTFLEGDFGGARRIPCIQGSDCWPERGDAHQLDAIGRRHCLIKLDDLSVAALRHALLDPSLRVRLVSQEQAEPVAVIEGVAVTGGFLDGQRFRFNDNISCLIGDTGAGKSLTLELIRFALDQRTAPHVLSKIADEVERLLQFALGDSANVRVLVRKNGDRYIVERAWQVGEPSDPVVYSVGETEVEAIDGPIHLPSFFPIRGFSQGEVIEHAREPLARLSLIDDLIDIESEQASVGDLKSQLRENAKALVETRSKVENSHSQVKELPGIQEQVKSLARFFEEPKVKEHQGWYRERDAFEAAEEQVSALLDEMDVDFPWPGSDWTIPEESPNEDVMRKLRDLAATLEQVAERRKSEYVEAVTELRTRIESLHAAWKASFETAERDYQRLLAELDKDRKGLASLSQKLTRLRERETKLQRVSKRVSEILEPELQRLAEERDALLDQLQSLRRAIRTKRKAKAKALTDRLEGKVRITVKGDADDRSFLEGLSRIRVGSFLQDSDIKTIARELHPVPLVKSLLSGDFEGPARESGLSASMFERLMDIVFERKRLEEFYELQLVELEDIVRIQFAVEGQEYRDLEALAHGQKCTVVLMVALAEGETPLMVDQPEDALHAPWIEEYIVARLRGDRGTRQCLFATRSGNVLVSSDTEQVIGMEADAHRGNVTKTGALDRFETRELVLYHVEGGREAFERRKQILGF